MAVAGSQTTRRDVVPAAAPLPTLSQAVRHWRRGAAPWLWSWRPFGHGPFIFGTLSPLPGECGGAEAVSEKEIGSSEVGTFSWSDSEDGISHSTSLKHIQSEWKRAIISQNGHWDPHPTDTWLVGVTVAPTHPTDPAPTSRTSCSIFLPLFLDAHQSFRRFWHSDWGFNDLWTMQHIQSGLASSLPHRARPAPCHRPRPPHSLIH